MYTYAKAELSDFMISVVSCGPVHCFSTAVNHVLSDSAGIEVHLFARS